MEIERPSKDKFYETVKEINPVILLRSEKVAVTPAAFKLIEAWV